VDRGARRVGRSDVGAVPNLARTAVPVALGTPAFAFVQNFTRLEHVTHVFFTAYYALGASSSQVVGTGVICGCGHGASDKLLPLVRRFVLKYHNQRIELLTGCIQCAGAPSITY
jgi:hypothetical protein